MFLSLDLSEMPCISFYSKVLELLIDKDDSGERAFLVLRVKKAMLWVAAERKLL